MVSAVLLVTLTGCGSDEPEPVADDPISVLVIGDSIPYNAPADCPGCIGFSEGYATGLEERVDTSVMLDNRSRHDGAQTRDIAEQLASTDLDGALASADVVLVSIGFNDQPPYFQAGQPCGAVVNSDHEAIAAVAATTKECVDQVMNAVQQEAAEVLSLVRDKAPDATIAALVPYDSWLGWSALDDSPPKVVARISDLVRYALDAWRTALCDEAEAVDGTCVDVYLAFNGVDGTTPAGDLLADDHTHPSQRGNDAIRDLLLEADLVTARDSAAAGA